MRDRGKARKPEGGQSEAREGWAERIEVAERPVVPGKPGNSGGGKGPWLEADAGSSEGAEIG